MIARKRPWVLRIGLCVAIGALLGFALPTRAAQTTATLAPGALTMTPTLVALSYDAPLNSAHVRFTSSFTVVVTDATGSKGGWQIRGAAVSLQGPTGAVASDAFAVIDFSVPAAQGTWPDPVCVCDTMPTTLATILQTPANTGMGKATITFTTQFALPDDAPRGQYSVTLILEVDPLGQVTTAPASGRGGPAAGGSVNPAPRPPVSAGGVPPDATAPAVAPVRRPESPTPGQPGAVSVESNSAPAPGPSGTATTTGAAVSRTAPMTDPTTTTDATTGQTVPAKVATISASAPTGPNTAPISPPNRAVTSAGGTDAPNAPLPAPGAAAPPALPATTAPPAPRSVGATQSQASDGFAPFVPAIIRMPTLTRYGTLTVLQSSVTVGHDDAHQRGGWRLQATLRTPDGTRSALQEIQGISLDVATLDSGGTPDRTLAYTLPTLYPSGGLLDLAVPSGSAPTNLLLTARFLLDDAGATFPSPTLTITLIAGP